MTALTTAEHRDPNAEFLERVEEYFAPHRQRANAKLDKAKAFYIEYCKSGLSQEDFAQEKGVQPHDIKNFLRRYHLPAAPRDPNVIKKAARKIRKRSDLEAVLKCDCGCFMCDQLKQELVDQHRIVDFRVK